MAYGIEIFNEQGQNVLDSGTNLTYVTSFIVNRSGSQQLPPLVDGGKYVHFVEGVCLTNNVDGYAQAYYPTNVWVDGETLHYQLSHFSHWYMDRIFFDWRITVMVER